ncbi:MAG: hypothetical protein CMO47_10250 [Verrucomicrobiales bacterium]|nr:hypothetical protein [Verrucomicrobiales bacterium]|tara:strand:- start:1689 stop:2522 length:834 start_codon:yes stop_codon:yes gene_type:complete
MVRLESGKNMNINSSIIFLQRPALSATVVAVGLLLFGSIQVTQGSDSPEVQELKAALSVAQKQLQAEREKVAHSEVQRLALVEGLAEAVRVSEEQVADARETQLKLQAFGVDLFNQDENSLEQRLLKAVRDLDLYQQDLERQAETIRSLSESFLGFAQSVEATETQRTTALKAIENARAAMALDEVVEGQNRGDISNSQVVSIDREIGLVVFDAGRREGLRIGTPITVLREDRPIYTAMIVDIRESIAGAVLQEKLIEAAEVAVGDGIQLQPNFFNF